MKLKDIYIKYDVIRNFICVLLYFLIEEFVAKYVYKLISFIIGDEASAMIVYEIVIYLLLFGVCLLFTFKYLKEMIIVLKKDGYKKTIVSIVIGFFGAIALMIICNMLIQSGGNSNSVNEQMIDEMMLTPLGLTLIPTICYIGPFVEEAVFRLSLQDGLIRMKIHPFVAIFITSLVFGFLHVMGAGDYNQVITYVVLGIWLCGLYQYTHNLAVNLFTHIAINCFSTGIRYILIIIYSYMPSVMIGE